MRGDFRRIILARLEMKQHWLGGDHAGCWYIPLYPAGDYVRGGGFKEGGMSEPLAANLSRFAMWASSAAARSTVQWRGW
jgi:hypothetical protein